ncbi:MAG: hypothetical protein AAB576_04985 [Elusimicrobiota bacterium]
MPLTPSFRRRLLFASACLLAGFPAQAGQKTLTLEADCGERKYSFDPAVISEERLRESLKLDLNTARGLELQTTPMLELCVSGSPLYRDCGSRSLGAPFFFENARANLAQGAKSLERVKALKVPKELHKVAAHVRESMSFSLWMEKTRLRFYESWKTEALKERYSWLDPSALCADAMKQVEEAGDRQAKYEAARSGWNNCINGAFRNRLGDPPAGDWEKFFSAYKVKVEPVGTEVCD